MKKYLLYLLPLLAVLSCEKAGNEAGGNGGKEDPTPKSCSVSGFAQKGQLAKGSQVTAFATGVDLVATGESFPANIADDRGSFAISGKTQAPYLELRVDGYYFNELEGAISSNPLYLEAFVESSGNKANLNLMTTAIKLRVKNLIKGGKSFTDANKQAQTELLSALGITAQTGNFFDMDITKGTESDAVLLAFACLMQNGRDAAGITTLVQELASDLETDGKISTENISKVFAGKESIDITKVIVNLDKFYTEKNIKDAVIPRFYGFIDERLNKDFVIYEGISYPYSTPGKPIEGASFYPFSGVYKILAQNDFEVSKDSEWLSFEKKHIVGPLYEVSFSGEQNSTEYPRTGHIVFKDKSGNVLETMEYNQGKYIAPKVTLYLIFDDGTKSTLSTDTPKKGDKVLVNDKLLEVYDVQGNAALVEANPAPFYRASWPAENMGFNQNPSYVVKTFPAEVTSSAYAQYYGAYKPLSGGMIYDDSPIRMSICTAMLSFNIACSHEASYAVISSNNSNDCLSGTATYIWVKNDLYLDPSLVEFYSFENKSNSVKVKDLDINGSNYVSVLPQTLQDGMTIQIFDSKGNLLGTKTGNSSMTFDRGRLYNLGAI